MRNYTLVVPSLLISFLLIGCASNGTAKNIRTTYPELKVLSDNVYVWDDSISEALNIAKLSTPAGVGVGITDMKDGRKASSGHISGGVQLADGALGLVDSGLTGLLTMGVLSSKVNTLLNWKPSVVLLTSENIFNNGVIDFKIVQTLLVDQLVSALSKGINDFELIGFKTTKYVNSYSDTSILFRSSECSNAMKFDHIVPEDAPENLSYGLMDSFLEGPLVLDNFCSVGFKISVSSKYQKGSERGYALVAELGGDGKFSSLYFSDVIAKNINSHFIVNDYYSFVVTDKRGRRKVVKSDYAYVIKNSEVFLFESK